MLAPSPCPISVITRFKGYIGFPVLFHGPPYKDIEHFEYNIKWVSMPIVYN